MAVQQKQLIEDTYPIQRRGDLGIKRFAAFLAASAADGTLPTYSNNANDIENIFDEFTAFALMSDTQAEAVFVDQLWKIGFGGTFVQSDEYLYLSDNNLGISFDNSTGENRSIIRADTNNVGYWSDGTFALYDTTDFIIYATTDTVTDYSRLRGYYDSAAQKFFLLTEAAGAGVEQALQFTSNGGVIELGYNALLTVYGRVNAGFLTVTSNQYQHQILHEIQVDSGETATMKLLPVHNETLTAGYVGYFLDATTTALGSGTHYFASWRKGGTSYFDFNYTGNIFIHNVDSVPGNPVDGVNLYSEGAVLKYKTPAGVIALIGAWAQDLTLATYITPNGYSNITVPGLVRIGSSSTNEGHTIEWQNGGGLGGGAIFTSLDSGNTGYYQFFQTTNRLFIAGFTASSGRLSVNSNAFDGAALGGFNGILHARFTNTNDDCGLLITRPTTITGNQQAIRLADSANLYFYIDAVGRTYLPNGSASSPSLSFVSDQDTGLSRTAANTITVSANAARVADFNATQFVIPASREFVVYGTADEVTNYERLRVNHSSNLVNFISESAGTGSSRTIQFQVANSTTFNFYRPISSASAVSLNFQLGDDAAAQTTYAQLFILSDVVTAGATYGYYTFRTRQNGALTSSQDVYLCRGYARGSSGTMMAHSMVANINQSGSAVWRGLQLNCIVAADVGTDNRIVNLLVNSARVFDVHKDGSLRTSDPSGGTAQYWKFGEATVATITPDRTLRVEVAGIAYLIDAQLA